MTTRIVQGSGLTAPRDWRGTRDEDGHREYKLKVRIASDDFKDGPATVRQTPGLPLPGSFWVLGNDVDNYAWCRWDDNVEPELSDEDPRLWTMEFRFSTKPPKERCRTTQVEDPLLEPDKISGTFVKYMQEATKDQFGVPILTSSFETIKGPQVEFDANRMGVRIEKNVALLNLSLVASMSNTVNANPLWGLPARCIKFSPTHWERRYWGQCLEYFTWQWDFEVRLPEPGNPDIGGFDRHVLDEGTKVLNGHWDPITGHFKIDQVGGHDPDPSNPQDFMRFVDRAGNMARVILNGSGLPAGAMVGTGTGTAGPGQPEGEILVQKYGQSDFTVLGIPTSPLFSFT